VLQRDPVALSRAAVAHADGFSWAHTVDALLDSYATAMTDYLARHARPPVRRSGRRFSMRRGVRA
jgi:D-inositol-3-phosphate glycosyltransferase